VLSGATVEASSPVLIERVRSVVTDDTGRYRVVDLRPGTYSVTFALPGFTSVKREGIELSGNFVATVDASLTVGQLAETVTVSGGLAEAETGGVVFNAVPREGSNNFSGQFNFSGSKGGMQASNYTQALKDAGLRAPFELINVYDTSGMYGGRIFRDKLWFYSVF